MLHNCCFLHSWEFQRDFMLQMEVFFFPCVFNKQLTNISPKSNCSSAAFWEVAVVYPMCYAAVLALLS